MKFNEWFCSEMSNTHLIVRGDFFGHWDGGTVSLEIWTNDVDSEGDQWGGVRYKCRANATCKLDAVVFPQTWAQVMCATLATVGWSEHKGWRQRKLTLLTRTQRVSSREVPPGEEIETFPIALGHPFVLQHLARLHGALSQEGGGRSGMLASTALRRRLEGLIKEGNRELNRAISMP
jgi:hypothetical protein